MIHENMIIKFDPCAAPQVIQQIFANKVARVLWLAIKPSHITFPGFDEKCLRYAGEIRKKMERSGRIGKEELLEILLALAVDAIGEVYEEGFAAELLPFINGEKKIAYTIDA